MVLEGLAMPRHTGNVTARERIPHSISAGNGQLGRQGMLSVND